MRVNEHIGHVVRSSVRATRGGRREHGSVDAISQSNTEAATMSSPVPLPRMAQQASEDHGWVTSPG